MSSEVHFGSNVCMTNNNLSTNPICTNFTAVPYNKSETVNHDDKGNLNGNVSLILPLSLTESVSGIKHTVHIIPSNKLKLIIVQDKNCSTPAAAMSVGVGSFHDPVEFPGLAHFCEHMLFMGTARYPIEGAYDKAVSSLGGQTNAWTAGLSTTYYFNISSAIAASDSLAVSSVADKKKDDEESASGNDKTGEDAKKEEEKDPFLAVCEIFIDFFISPSFNKSAVLREVKVVHSEDEKNHENDFWRIDELLRTFAKPEHPRSRYGSGNLTTLLTEPTKKGLDLRAALIDFFAKYYVAEASCMVVYSALSAEKMISFLTPLLSKIHNINESSDDNNAVVKSARSFLPPGRYETKREGDKTDGDDIDDPYSFPSTLIRPEVPGKWYNILTRKKSRQIRLTWFLPYGYRHYRASPGSFAFFILSHEAKGSIIDTLRRYNLATDLVGGCHHPTDDENTLASIDITLTSEGIDKLLKVVEIVFHAIEMLRRTHRCENHRNRTRAVCSHGSSVKDNPAKGAGGEEKEEKEENGDNNGEKKPDLFTSSYYSYVKQNNLDFYFTEVDSPSSHCTLLGTNAVIFQSLEHAFSGISLIYEDDIEAQYDFLNLLTIDNCVIFFLSGDLNDFKNEKKAIDFVKNGDMVSNDDENGDKDNIKDNKETEKRNVQEKKIKEYYFKGDSNLSLVTRFHQTRYSVCNIPGDEIDVNPPDATLTPKNANYSVNFKKRIKNIVEIDPNITMPAENPYLTTNFEIYNVPYLGPKMASFSTPSMDQYPISSTTISNSAAVDTLIVSSSTDFSTPSPINTTNVNVGDTEEKKRSFPRISRTEYCVIYSSSNPPHIISPIVNVSINFISASAGKTKFANYLMKVITDVFTEQLAEMTYFAECAAINSSVEAQSSGFMFSASGPFDTVLRYTLDVVRTVFSATFRARMIDLTEENKNKNVDGKFEDKETRKIEFKEGEKYFIRQHDKTLRTLRGIVEQQPYTLANTMTARGLSSKYSYFWPDQLMAGSDKEKVNFKAYCEGIQSLFFSCIRLEVCVTGNLPNLTVVEEFGKEIDNILHKEKIRLCITEEIPRYRDLYKLKPVKIEKKIGEADFKEVKKSEEKHNINNNEKVIPPLLLIRHKPFTKHNTNAAIVLTFHVVADHEVIAAADGSRGKESADLVKDSVVADCLSSLISSPFFASLRNAETLGYIVYARAEHSVSGKLNAFSFIAQSALHGPLYLFSRIVAFLDAFEEQILDIPFPFSALYPPHPSSSTNVNIGNRENDTKESDAISPLLPSLPPSTSSNTSSSSSSSATTRGSLALTQAELDVIVKSQIDKRLKKRTSVSAEHLHLWYSRLHCRGFDYVEQEIEQLRRGVTVADLQLMFAKYLSNKPHFGNIDGNRGNTRRGIVSMVDSEDLPERWSIYDLTDKKIGSKDEKRNAENKEDSCKDVEDGNGNIDTENGDDEFHFPFFSEFEEDNNNNTVDDAGAIIRVLLPSKRCEDIKKKERSVDVDKNTDNSARIESEKGSGDEEGENINNNLILSDFAGDKKASAIFKVLNTSSGIRASSDLIPVDFHF